MHTANMGTTIEQPEPENLNDNQLRIVLDMPLDEKSETAQLITNRQDPLQSTQPIELSPRRTESLQELDLATIKLHNEVAAFANKQPIHSRADSQSLQFVSVPAREMQIAINTNIHSRQQPVKAATVKLSVKQSTRFNEGKSENGTHRSIRKSNDGNYAETPERGLDPEFLKFCSSM